jgi:polysaccharide deacetylase family protein (PEP-CTERM system associated)
MLNVFSVDVEDYFHPAELQAVVHRHEWSAFSSRVEVGTMVLLDALSAHGVKGTFFVLGWIAQIRPKLIREIACRGHEIACHSHEHRLVYHLTPTQFQHDTVQAIKAIEDACGLTPRAYRAPSYSITERSIWALEVLVERGFTHDSSIYPVVHDRYGIPGFGRHAQLIATPAGPLMEIPPATVRLSGSRVVPVGGGGYLRLLPYRYTAAGIRRINNQENQPACIYVHPWELDPGQPRLATGVISRVRTYGSLRTMQPKLHRLLADFRFSTLRSVYQHPPEPIVTAQAS